VLDFVDAVLGVAELLGVGSKEVSAEETIMNIVPRISI
jgi:hypothetical protein